MGPGTGSRCQGRLAPVLRARHGVAHKAQVSVNRSIVPSSAAADSMSFSQCGQTSTAEVARRDLRAELLEAEAAARAKKGLAPLGEKRPLEVEPAEEDEAAKRRKLLQDAIELDRDDDDEDDEGRWCARHTRRRF